MSVAILRLPNFNMLFQLVLTKLFKSELFMVAFLEPVERERSGHASHRAFLSFARILGIRERLCLNRKWSLLSMRCMLLGYTANKGSGQDTYLIIHFHSTILCTKKIYIKLGRISDILAYSSQSLRGKCNSKRCLKFRLTSNYEVKKCKLREKSRAKMANTAFAPEFTILCKLGWHACGIYHFSH